MKSIWLIPLFIAHVTSHAGLLSPTPRSPGCAVDSPLENCGLEIAPCGGIDAGPLSELSPGAVDIIVLQRVAHPSTLNTYTINLVSGEQIIELSSQPQVESAGSDDLQLTFPVTIPDDVNLTNAHIQMIFDATPGGGSVYYSCADITQAEAPSSTSLDTITDSTSQGSSDAESTTANTPDSGTSSTNLPPDDQPTHESSHPTGHGDTTESTGSSGSTAPSGDVEPTEDTEPGPDEDNAGCALGTSLAAVLIAVSALLV